MFREGGGAELVYGVADYWVSRVKWNPEDQKYHLLGETANTEGVFWTPTLTLLSTFVRCHAAR